MRLTMVGSRVTTGRIIATDIFWKFRYDIEDDVIMGQVILWMKKPYASVSER